ncbi:sulfite exporter TauE/SafE family protein [Virgibacillus sp. AGTR]|uniref:sulfite exporter TauE/SafE family protein n=1 Tax=Virgibacillus sp. AGTR TaxID=2812055 RepID=UPI00196654F9|nr:sulfite exporter TauE/SafE family protein [Virgibacillus sp. AGTR]MCC2249497.1 sulfite exporter TauE/SafE family protein [Virgibacillus sp. AGTR]QRZ17862.1 sulfite exporter TauE/SafE family protein [Virgibacillus sp. AGTR]
MVFVICILIGILTAFVGGLMGLGGGIILIPSLLFLNQLSDAFSWATPQAIVGISLVSMVFTAMSSTIAYYKRGRVDYKTGLLFLSGSLPGGMIGSWLNQFIDGDQFLLYFGCITIVISLLFFIKRKEPTKQISNNISEIRTFELNGITYQYTVSKWVAFVLSLIVGALSGLFGIGGGSIMVPAMILLFGIPAHIATTTSMFMIFFISIIGAGTHIALGHIEWQYVFLFIPGAWIGGKLGAWVNQLLTGKTLEWILRIVLIIIGIRMISQGLS